MKVAWHPLYNHPLQAGHRFPMIKYDLLREQLLYEGIVTNADFLHPHGVDVEQILLTHAQPYLEKLLNGQLTAAEIRRTGFPYSESLIQREITIMDGTLLCALHALDCGIGLNIAGGTHHAFREHGEGFCLLNDFAIAINILLNQKRIARALIIDLDVHQGNGSASLFQNDSRVFTFSMHGEKNYPMHKEKSDLDIELPDGTTDDVYLKTLAEILPQVVESSQPDIVFYQCGVDILAADKLGRLSISMDGCRMRDHIVFEYCRNHGLPVVCAMGGGYSPDIRTIVDAHANTFRLARHFWC
ncbi:MAG: histone deacetylase [Flavobacteriales bacterium]|nr:histone deacetylase [Flavobacteriales bacterium]